MLHRTKHLAAVTAPNLTLLQLQGVVAHILLLIFIKVLITVYKLCNISAMIRLRLVYLVSLKRLILLSNSDLVLNRSAIFPLTLASQMLIKNCVTIHTIGVSLVCSTCSSSLST